MPRTLFNASMRCDVDIAVSDDDCVVDPALILNTDDLDMYLELLFLFSNCVVCFVVTIKLDDVNACSIQIDLAMVTITMVIALAVSNRIINDRVSNNCSSS